jgi:hypothetical protein
MVGFHKKAAQPFLSPHSFGKVEAMKNGKLFLRMKDGNIVEGDLIYLH